MSESSKEFGIIITAKGVYDAATGIKLTTAEVNKLGDALKDGAREFEGFERKTEAAQQGVEKFSTSTKAGIAAVAVAIVQLGRQFYASMQAQHQYIDSLAELGERTGKTVSDLAAYDYALRMSDSSLQTYTNTMARFSKVLFDAQAGRKQAAGTFALLGIDPRELKDAEEGLLRVADAFARISSYETKSALAKRLGIDQDLITYLSQGSIAIHRLTDEGRTWNAVTNEAAKESKRLADELKQLQFTWDSVARTVMSAVVPAINEYISDIKTAKEVGGGWLGMLKVGTADREDPSGKVKKLREELQLLRDTQAYWERERGVVGVNASAIADLEKQIQFAERIRNQELLKKIDSGEIYDAMDARRHGRLHIDPSDLDDEGKREREAAARAAARERERLAQRYWASEEAAALARASAAEDEYYAKGQEWLQRKKALQNEVRQILEQTMTPQERHNQQLERYAELMRQGHLSTEQYARAVAHAQEEVAKLTETDKWEGMEQAIRNVAESSAEMAADFLINNGKMSVSFSDFIRSVLHDIAKLQMKKQLEPLIGAAGDVIGDFMKGLAGGGGTGGIFGPYAGLDYSGADLGTYLGLYHSGGVVGREPTSYRAMPAPAIASLPRYHSGRLAPDEEVAVLRRDESVLTPGQMAKLAPAGQTVPVKVEIINKGTPQRTDQVSAQQTPEGLVVQVITNDLRNGGRIARAMEGTYGLHRGS